MLLLRACRMEYPRMVGRRWLHLTDSVTSDKVAASLLGSGEGPLSWYSCGPTVYDETHLGHARAYVSIDILQRVFETLTRRPVLHLMGMTDVDDKILAAAQQKGTQPLALARRFEGEFHDNLRSLGVRSPAVVLRVSEHVEEIVAMAEGIQRNGYAYQGRVSGSLYFDTQRFEQALAPYDKLVPRCHAEDSHAAHDGEQRSAAEKKHAKDFVLWKTRALSDAAPFSVEHSSCLWQSPWGVGRPGWHIECSAMCFSAIGRDLDVHAGGIDLAFPHHANEIVQTAAFHNDASLQWPRCFVHVGHVYIQGQKMSKSLKNFTSVSEFLQTHTAEQFRLFCLQHHYRSQVDYSADRMQEAQALLNKVKHFHLQIDSLIIKQKPQDASKWGDSERLLWQRFSVFHLTLEQSLRDDFDTPAALKALFELISSTFQYLSQSSSPNRFLLAVVSSHASSLWTHSFGFSALTSASSASTSSNLDVPSIVDLRETIRKLAISAPSEFKQPLFAISDRMRNEILKPLGIQIVDAKPKGGKE